MILQYHNGGVIVADTAPKSDRALVEKIRTIINENVAVTDRFNALAALVPAHHHADLYRFIQTNPSLTVTRRWIEARR